MQRQRAHEVERQVRAMLGRSTGYRRLPAAQQAEILRNTTSIVETMAENKLAQGRARDPYAIPLEDPLMPAGPSFPGELGGDTSSTQPQFTGGVQPGAAAEALAPKQIGEFGTGVAVGVGQAGALLRQVNFPAFVAELVQGVFQAVVDASIQQMQAYGELVQGVAMSLSDFRDANVSENQARDHLVSKFPSIMKLNITDGGPRVGLRDDYDEDAAAGVASSLGIEGEFSDLDDETIEQELVPAARDDLARSRQALLATTLLMGINRIVVTNGKINAKMKFDFTASDSMTMSARDYEYQNAGSVRIEQGNRWTSGNYQSIEAPQIRLTNITNTDTAAMLEAQAKLSGEVSLNFKSETFDLNQLASADQVFQIQRAQSAGRAAPPAPASATTSPQATVGTTG